MLNINIVLGPGRLILPESIKMGQNVGLVPFGSYSLTPGGFIPYDKWTFATANKTGSNHNCFQLLELRNKARFFKLFSHFSSDPHPARCSSNIESTFIRPDNLGPVLYTPYFVGVGPGVACL